MSRNSSRYNGAIFSSHFRLVFNLRGSKFLSHSWNLFPSNLFASSQNSRPRLSRNSVIHFDLTTKLELRIYQVIGFLFALFWTRISPPQDTPQFSPFSNRTYFINLARKLERYTYLPIRSGRRRILLPLNPEQYRSLFPQTLPRRCYPLLCCVLNRISLSSNRLRISTTTTYLIVTHRVSSCF